jgi:beta-lactamase regulating signal transducer with metallopeptidase domain
MSLHIPVPEPGNLLLQLSIAAARTALLAGVAGLLLKTFGVNITSIRLLTWKAVLFAGLLTPFVAWWVPAIPISVPGLPSHAALGSVQVVNTGHSNSASSAHSVEQNMLQTPGLGVGQAHASDNQQHPATAESLSSRIIAIASFAYLLLATLLLSRLLIGIAFTRRLVRCASAIHETRVTSLRLASGRTVPVCESALVSVPVTLGAFTPTILLPLAWRKWDQAKLQSALSHEFSHAVRFDGLAKLTSLLNRAIFWFSPLAWWLDRHITELAEEVSDEAALSAGAERNQYARNLLGFFNTIHGAAGRVRWEGVSMATSGNAERRLEKILAWRGDRKMKAKTWIVLLAIALGIPAVYLIAVARPVQSEQPAQNAGSAQEQSGAPPAPPASEGAPVAPSAPAASTAPTAPEEPVSSPGGTEQTPSGNHHHGYFYSYGNNDEQRFVIVSGKMDGFTMSGSGQDARHVERLRKQIPGDFIWFQRDEKSYIIRDSATVERGRQLWAPQQELGKKQEELGKQQEALGKQQEELGTRMQAVRVKVPDMSAELDKLKAELKQLGPNASMEQIGRIQSEIGELQSRIGETQSHAGDEQGKIGAEMGALGEQQGKLGSQQGELGRQQGELAEKANREMKKLLDDAIKNGTAKPESDQSGGESI